MAGQEAEVHIVEVAEKLFVLFRSEQSNSGHVGCCCPECVANMGEALKKLLEREELQIVRTPKALGEDGMVDIITQRTGPFAGDRAPIESRCGDGENARVVIRGDKGDRVIFTGAKFSEKEFQELMRLHEKSLAR